ncbi:MAG: hypothetical protein QOH81_2180 [Sphingomonadales bacterium]|jgi:hypothetical protein|nr:hypothetical protein [Sphingomonadales bacterium]
MLEALIILGLAALVIVMAASSYRRRAGVTSGAGRGAPASPLIPALLAALAALGAILLFFLLRGR